MQKVKVGASVAGPPARPPPDFSINAFRTCRLRGMYQPFRKVPRIVMTIARSLSVPRSVRRRLQQARHVAMAPSPQTGVPLWNYRLSGRNGQSGGCDGSAVVRLQKFAFGTRHYHKVTTDY